MDFATVAERLTSLDRSAVSYTAARCLYATDRFSTCQACATVCPVAAITPPQVGGPVPGHAPALNAAACVNCFACLPVCPNGAFSADDAVAPLLDCAARVEGGHVEVICARQPDPELGPDAGATAIRVRGCLAGLGVSALVGLAALGAETIVLRADACAECAWSHLAGQLAGQVAQAQQLLTPLGRAASLTLQVEAPSHPVERLLLEADNPPLSRRDLFRMVARRSQVVLARAMNETGGATGPHPARERARLLKALAAFPARTAPADPTWPAGLGFALVLASDACSACGTCARACPTGALVFERVEPQAYQLLFHPELCTGCAACQRVCAPAALSLDPQPAYAAVFGQTAPTVLRSGNLVRCADCRTWMAASGQSLCPTCQSRRAHPFGPRPMPGRVKVQS